MKPLIYQQKIAIMRILQDIIMADGRIDVRETALYNEIAKELELDEDIREDVNKKLSIIALLDIKYFKPEQKTYFANIMSRMIVVDENIDMNELAVYNVVREYCGIKLEFNQ